MKVYQGCFVLGCTDGFRLSFFILFFFFYYCTATDIIDHICNCQVPLTFSDVIFLITSLLIAKPREHY